MTDWFAVLEAARRRLHKRIDIACDLALGKDTKSTINRRYGQLYRDRAAELRDATEGRR